MIVSVKGANQQRKMYCKVARHTVSVRGHRGTIRRLDRDTGDHKNLARQVEADSIVVKTLWTVLVSSCDGVPLKLKKGKWPTRQFKIIY